MPNPRARRQHHSTRLAVDNFVALLSGSIAAWLERQAAVRIEYRKAENRALRSRPGGRRIIFADAERRTLGTLAETEQLVVRMATGNTRWGYTRILGALSNLGIRVGRGTVQRILKDHLIEPAPIRRKRIAWSLT